MRRIFVLFSLICFLTVLGPVHADGIDLCERYQQRLERVKQRLRAARIQGRSDKIQKLKLRKKRLRKKVQKSCSFHPALACQALQSVSPRSSDFPVMRVLSGESCHEENTPLVSVLALNGSGDGKLCTGVHIGDGLVLTAAHCFVGAEVFFVGQSDWYANVERMVIDSRFYTSQPDPFPFGDFALLETGLPSGRVPKASLLPQSSALEEGETAIIAGFGYDELGGLGELRTGFTRVYSWDAHRVFTRGRRGDANVCFGDSGGPLLVRRDGRWKLAGLLSAGSTTSCDLDEINSFTRLSESFTYDLLQSFLPDLPQ